MSTDCFFKHGKYINVCDNQKKITNNKWQSDTAYGSHIINTHNNTNCYFWTLKASKLVYRAEIVIGIQDVNDDCFGVDFTKNKSNDDNKIAVFYGYSDQGLKVCCHPNENMKSMSGFGDNDTILMELNLNTKMLTFYKIGWFSSKSMLAQFSNVTTGQSIKYRLAIHLKGGAAITIQKSSPNDKVNKIINSECDEKIIELQNELHTKEKIIDESKQQISALNEMLTQRDNEIKRYQKMIDALLMEKSEQKEEKQEAMNITSIESILNNLKMEMNNFKNDYNVQSIEIIKNQSLELLLLNKNKVKMYEDHINDLNVISNNFQKYISETKLCLDGLSIPNIKKYQQWNITSIINWIKGLEQGRFTKYVDRLQIGLEESEILSGNHLPELTTSDLSSSPFNIKSYPDRKDMIKHFQSLLDHSLCEGQDTDYL